MDTHSQSPIAKIYDKPIPRLYRGAYADCNDLHDASNTSDPLGCVQFAINHDKAASYLGSKIANRPDSRYSVYECEIDGAPKFAEFASEDEMKDYGKRNGFGTSDPNRDYRRSVKRLSDDGFNGFVNLEHQEFAVFPTLPIKIISQTLKYPPDSPSGPKIKVPNAPTPKLKPPY